MSWCDLDVVGRGRRGLGHGVVWLRVWEIVLVDDVVCFEETVDFLTGWSDRISRQWWRRHVGFRWCRMRRMHDFLLLFWTLLDCDIVRSAVSCMRMMLLFGYLLIFSFAEWSDSWVLDLMFWCSNCYSISAIILWPDYYYYYYCKDSQQCEISIIVIGCVWVHRWSDSWVLYFWCNDDQNDIRYRTYEYYDVISYYDPITIRLERRLKWSGRWMPLGSRMIWYVVTRLLGALMWWW